MPRTGMSIWLKTLFASLLMSASGCCGRTTAPLIPPPVPAMLTGPKPEIRGDRIELDKRDFDELLRELLLWRAREEASRGTPAPP